MNSDFSDERAQAERFHHRARVMAESGLEPTTLRAQPVPINAMLSCLSVVSQFFDHESS